MIHGGFWIVILAQAFWFLVTTVALRNTEKTLVFLFAGLALGIPYGLAMDSLVGYRTGIFNYQGLEDSLSFLFLNALLSYGLAISTMFNFVPFLTSGIAINRRFSYFFILIGSSVLFFHARFGGVSPLVDMFSVGVIILCFSDAVFILFSGKCMTLNLVSLNESLIRIGMFSAATGAFYEATNYFARLWVWENDFPSQGINFLMIVLFGYFVLLFPMLVLAFVFQSTLSLKSQ